MKNREIAQIPPELADILEIKNVLNALELPERVKRVGRREKRG